MVNSQEYINNNYPQEIRKNLKSLEISGKDLEGHLDLKDFISLERLDCYENRITNLDVTQNKNLTEIHFSYGQISSIDLSKNKNLNFVNFNNNLLRNLDLT